MGKKIQIYGVPDEWVVFLENEAKKLGMSVSDYVKAFILQPYIKKRMGGEE